MVEPIFPRKPLPTPWTDTGRTVWANKRPARQLVRRTPEGRKQFKPSTRWEGTIFIRRGVGNPVAELSYEARLALNGTVYYGYGSTIEKAYQELAIAKQDIESLVQPQPATDYKTAMLDVFRTWFSRK